MLKKWFSERRSSFAGGIFFDQPLARHTYYGVGGPAAVIVVPQSLPDLQLIAQALEETKSDFFILGAGSNILASDSGFPGLIIKTEKINTEILQAQAIRTGASVRIPALLRQASKGGWGGFEFLAGIPGTVGGAVVMNAGTHLGEAKDLLRRLEVFLLKKESQKSATPDKEGLVVFEADQLKFEYRKNLFLPEGAVVYAAEWEVRAESPEKVHQTIQDVLTRRKSTQPLDRPSCGSVFKNPVGTPHKAWQVIEKLGLRGHRIGGAQFAEKHCNFILNLGGATATDIHSLIVLAKTRAEHELGMLLEEEVKYLGKF